MVRKLNSFTLSEMLVVLLLTTFVVGISFSVLQLIQKQMHGIEGNFEQRTEYNLLYQSLWINFNQYDGVWYNADLNQLTFVNEINTLEYKISETYVTKQKDTFFIKIDRPQFFFKGKPQSFGEIDAMDFFITAEGSKRRFFVFKKNAATSYLNN